MATGFMPRIIALVLLLACGAAAAADVALVGVIGDKAAVLVVDGGDPKTVRVGQKWNGITVLSVARDRATVEIDGLRRMLIQGPHSSAPGTGSGRAETTLAADAYGHFVANGAVNGQAVRFVVDTGATVVALPARDAQRLGLDYRRGPQGSAQTAGGTVPVYRLSLESVKLGDIELRSVDAIVIEQGLETALLGMSFLNRVEMKRDGSTMTLTRRF
jgi:aspartyl protease family protein